MREMKLKSERVVMGLLAQKDGIFCFGTLKKNTHLADISHQVRHYVNVLVLVSFIGVFYGIYSTGIWRLGIVLLAMIILFLVIHFLDVQSQQLPSNTIELDENDEMVRIPKGRMGGEYPMAELAIRLCEDPSKNKGLLLFWVVLEGEIQDREALFTFQLELYGPDHRGEALAAVREIEKLGSWKSAEVS